MGSRALLHQAGFQPTWWPQAGQYYCSTNNIVGKPGCVSTPFRQRNGTDFPGEFIPFGAAVRALLPEMR
eukprot:12252645-Heterocapsa_arctica.AAC.1